MDWGPEIDIAGFVFLELASSFKPPETLSPFLDAGDPPVYIEFGNIGVDDPHCFTKLVFQAVKKGFWLARVGGGLAMKAVRLATSICWRTHPTTGCFLGVVPSFITVVLKLRPLASNAANQR